MSGSAEDYKLYCGIARRGSEAGLFETGFRL